VLGIYDPDKQTIKRIAASNTKEASEAIKALSIPFNEIEIPISDTHNLMARALRENKNFTTTDVYDVLGPVLSIQEATKIQEIMGTHTTLVYPLFMGNKPIGVFLASTSKSPTELSSYEYDIIKAFVDGAAIALQHSALYRDLGKRSTELRDANVRLQELDKMKDEFVSLASHELRTPMTAIKSYLWMALNKHGEELSAKERQYLDVAYNSTERLITLVNDMLNVSRIESGRITLEKQPTSLDKLSGDVIAEIMPRAQETGLALTLRVDPALPKVNIDSNKMKEVLLNLIGNSLKFTPKGGQITVSVSNKIDRLQVEIADTGKGIVKEDMPKLFQKFGLIEGSYTSNSAYQGTGLGLYITKSIIELHGGKIWVTSDGRDKGSHFIFTIPVAAQATIANASSQGTSSPHSPSPQG
jgi:signal transduction histidine kinase